MLRCVSITPLGRPVVPDEYGSAATNSDGVTRACAAAMARELDAAVSEHGEASAASDAAAAEIWRNPRGGAGAASSGGNATDVDAWAALGPRGVDLLSKMVETGSEVEVGAAAELKRPRGG